MSTLIVNVLRLTQKEFDELPEYSCSLPTGQVQGKRWKRLYNGYWLIGEYGVVVDDRRLIYWYSPKIMTPDETLIKQRLYAN